MGADLPCAYCGVEMHFDDCFAQMGRVVCPSCQRTNNLYPDEDCNFGLEPDDVE